MWLYLSYLVFLFVKVTAATLLFRSSTTIPFLSFRLTFEVCAVILSNMLAMGAGIVGPNLALSIVETFLNTPFSGDEKHVRRINKIEEEVK